MHGQTTLRFLSILSRVKHLQYVNWFSYYDQQNRALVCTRIRCNIFFTSSFSLLWKRNFARYKLPITHSQVQRIPDLSSIVRWLKGQVHIWELKCEGSLNNGNQQVTLVSYLWRNTPTMTTCQFRLVWLENQKCISRPRSTCVTNRVKYFHTLIGFSVHKASPCLFT